jgi:hypothetical protein
MPHTDDDHRDLTGRLCAVCGFRYSESLHHPFVCSADARCDRRNELADCGHYLPAPSRIDGTL